MSNFLPSVDNLSHTTDVHSILVVPVYGHRDYGDEESDEDLFPELADSADEDTKGMTFGKKRA